MVQLIIINLEAQMTAIFPSEEWLKGLEEKLNSDERYGEIAKEVGRGLVLSHRTRGQS